MAILSKNSRLVSFSGLAFWIITLLMILATATAAADLPEGLDTFEFLVNGTDIVQNPQISLKVEVPVDIELNITTQPAYNFIIHDVVITIGVFSSFNLSSVKPSIKDLSIDGGTTRNEVIENVVLLDYVPESLKPFVASLTGTIPVTFKIYYSVNGLKQPVWEITGEIVVLIDSILDIITSPIGAVAVGTTAITFVLFGFNSLKELLGYLITKIARGQISKKIVRASVGRFTDKRCPRCDTRFRKGVCDTCRLTRVQAFKEYTEDVKKWASQSLQIIEDKHTINIELIREMLNITPKQAKDVYVEMTQAKLTYATGLFTGIPKRLIFMGLTAGVSLVLWGLAGGVLPLSPRSIPISIGIIILLVIIPFVAFKLLEPRRRAKIAYRASEYKKNVENSSNED